MNTFYIDITFEGNKFSPHKLQTLTSLPIEALVEYGEKANKGRYKDSIAPYGLGLLKIGSATSEKLNKVLSNALDYLILVIKELKISGVDEINLDKENIEEIGLDLDKVNLEKIALINDSLNAKSNSERNVENYQNKVVYFSDVDITKAFYSSLYRQSSILNGLSEQKENRLKLLLDKTFEFPYNNIKMSQSELTTAIMLYIIRYMEEDDLDEIPPFEKVLKENYLVLENS